MSDNIIFSKNGVEPLIFFKNFLELDLASYNFSEASNALISSMPSIVYENPIQIDQSASTTMASSVSTFPFIGLELCKKGIVKEQKKEERAIEIDSSFISELSSNTFLERLNIGYLITDTQIQSLSDTLALYDTEGSRYLGMLNRYKMNDELKIIAWSETNEERFYFEKILSRSLSYAKEELKTIGIPSDFEVKADLYHYDEDHLIYGVQYNIKITNQYDLYVFPTAVEVEVNSLQDYVFSDLSLTTLF